MPGIIKASQIESKVFDVLYFDGLQFNLIKSQPFIFMKLFPWIELTSKPDTYPTKKPINNINNPVTGSLAINRKAASPIVAVKAATTDPNDALPLEYWVKTIIAPPQPGRAPRKELIKTSNFGLFKRIFFTSIFRYFSYVKKSNNVPATKLVTPM